jgi:hypothetical protein
MSYSAIVSYNSANPREISLMMDLENYLGKMNISALLGDPNIPEHRMKQELLNAQWLVLFLTPQAIKSPQIQSLVNAAFVRVRQGLMQGVLALAFSSNPVDLEAMPSLSWSTIRIYYTGEMDEDHQQVFEKLSRTLGYNKVAVPAASSPTNNWASSFSSAASRPQPAIAQSSQKQRSGLTVPLSAALTLLLIILVVFGSTALILKKPFATSSPKVNGTSITHTKPSIHVSPSVISNTSTPTPQGLYDAITKSKNYALNNSMSVQSDSQWDTKNTSCAFEIDEMYHVTSLPGQYMSCMARKPRFTANFAYQVQLTFNGGDAGGLIFFSNDTVSTFYRFSLNSAGNYSLRKCQNCFNTEVTNGQLLSKENGNIAQSNIPIGNLSYTLTVIVTNKTIYLYVQDIPVDQVTNSTNGQEGEIGLYAASGTQSAGVAFSTLKVWNLKESGDVQK